MAAPKEPATRKLTTVRRPVAMRKVSMREAALIVLRESGSEMTVADIYEAILKVEGYTPGKGKTPKRTLAAILYTRTWQVEKTGRATFRCAVPERPSPRTGQRRTTGPSGGSDAGTRRGTRQRLSTPETRPAE